jgi:hypothetical protein
LIAADKESLDSPILIPKLLLVGSTKIITVAPEAYQRGPRGKGKSRFKTRLEITNNPDEEHSIHSVHLPGDSTIATTNQVSRQNSGNNVINNFNNVNTQVGKKIIAPRRRETKSRNELQG